MSELIEKEKLNIIIIIILLIKNFRFLSGCGKALPELGWTHKCMCRLEK